MFHTEKRLLNEIAGDLAGVPGVALAIVYGSRIRGDFRADSDYDVMIVVREKSSSVKDAILTIFYDRELAFDLSFSVTIFSQREFDTNRAMGSPFLQAVLTEGLVFYDVERSRKEESIGVPT
jgi:predicted nucleotidyltransferase